MARPSTCTQCARQNRPGSPNLGCSHARFRGGQGLAQDQRVPSVGVKWEEENPTGEMLTEKGNTSSKNLLVRDRLLGPVAVVQLLFMKAQGEALPRAKRQGVGQATPRSSSKPRDPRCRVFVGAIGRAKERLCLLQGANRHCMISCPWCVGRCYPDTHMWQAARTPRMWLGGGNQLRVR